MLRTVQHIRNNMTKILVTSTSPLNFEGQSQKVPMGTSRHCNSILIVDGCIWLSQYGLL